MSESPRRVPILVDRTLTEQVVRQLRKQIMLGQLESGQRLTEVQLAEELAVSRSTVREALRRLESEYLVESLSHRGSRVACLTPADAAEVCELHAMLEAHCLKYLPLPLSDDLCTHLQAVVDDMSSLAFPAEVDRFIDLDHEFHGSLVRAAEQRWVLHVWSDISALLGVIVTLSLRYLSLAGPSIAARHQAIIDGLSRPDASREVAMAVAEEHYRSLARELHEHGLAMDQPEN